jgi:ribosomal protein S18 acetylase RimI-like enzyme
VTEAPLFATTDVAQRIERAEAGLSADVGRACLARKVPGAFVEAVGGGVAVFGGDGSPVNKVIGVGFAGAPLPDELDRVEAGFLAASSHVQAEVATLAQPEWHAALAPRGYALAGFENVLGMPLAGVAGAPPADIVVRRCPVDHDADWLEAVATGFQHPDDVPAQPAGQDFPRDVIERVFRDLASARGFLRYVALIDGVVAGGASLRLCEGIAQLCGAATLPAFRRRGVQTALVRARLRDARDEGCDLAVVTTAPGSKSQQNAQRQGFALLYSRAIHIKPLR